MEENELTARQQHFKIYIKDHWSEVKDLGTKELRLVLT